ncbi:RBBP9/YdeN family alpha/beta hydrolase [Brachybacterium hainanense]|uniref:RBBP9/YdeN family alpha/beta hydrolase n=1 Tax=Brachybacterium hainanense TaxID=1541174 RepID=A0ABV6RD94_9MICO
MRPAPPTSPATPRRALIFHGYGATPADHWFGRLAEQLGACGISTEIPALPDPGDPHPGRWEDAVRAALGTPDEQTIVIAHSLGCLSVLRVLRSLPDPWGLGMLILVSGFTEPLPALPELDRFIAGGCDATRLPGRIDRLLVVRSDDDPIVPPPHTDRVAEQLGVTARVVPGAGHFLAADGVTELPLVRDAIVAPPRHRCAGADRPIEQISDGSA